MLRSQLSLSVLATAFALFAGSGEVEARHCRNQCRPHHHRQNQNCNRVHHHNSGYATSGYGNSNHGGTHHGWNMAGEDAFGHNGYGTTYYGNGNQRYSY